MRNILSTFLGSHPPALHVVEDPQISEMLSVYLEVQSVGRFSHVPLDHISDGFPVDIGQQGIVGFVIVPSAN